VRTQSSGYRRHVTLVDTGPLVALINANDPYHAPAVAQLAQLPRSPLFTTAPCITEAMYLLHQAGGYAAQEALWNMLERGSAVIYALEETNWQRMRRLMTTYSDAPMDLADASLVAAAEITNARRIFTFDRHFYANRLSDGGTLEVFPA
jgi:predicted nucleic acid-binding protein